MLLELTQSPLALELKIANEGIVKLLEALTAEDADYQTAMSVWDHPGKPTKAGVDAVLALPRPEREELWRAVAADVAFDESFDQPDFAFAFHALDESTRRAGRQLLVSMYETVFSGGGFALPVDPKATRTTWELAFREANPSIRVCPACLLSNLEERIENRAAIDADHYLPRALYPTLSVHGLNLVPTCKTCNQTAKRQKNPLGSGDGAEPLGSIWFPYRQAGVEDLALGFQLRSANTETLVNFAGKPGAERQAELFDELFLLSTRWSRTLPSIHSRIVTQVLTYLKVHPDLASPLTEPAVADVLRTLGSMMEHELSNTPGEYVAGRYCAWLAETAAALSAFVTELEDTLARNRPS
ncbi:MAG TPA: hypothetical protein VGI17_05680 [Solirubrobacterales bacterium]|jgi:hypothetical protein